MSSRTWCPAIDANSSLEFDKSHMLKDSDKSTINCFLTKGSAKENGALGARCGAAAEQFGTELMQRTVPSIQKFSTYVVASRANLMSWPSLESPFIITLHSGIIELITKTDDEVEYMAQTCVPVVVHHISHIWKACPQLEHLPAVQLPADQLVDFVTYIMRTESQRKSYTISENLRDISLQPSLSKTTLISDLLGALSANRRMIEHVYSLRLAGEFREDSVTHLQELFQLAGKLSILALPYTSLGRVVETLVALLKSSKIAVLDMEGNDLGLDTDESEVVTLLAEYIKDNKFLIDLNLNYNNITGESARILFEALSASDTKFTPLDFADSIEREGHDSIEEQEFELNNISFFLPRDNMNDEEDEEGEREEDEEEEKEMVESTKEHDEDDTIQGYDGENRSGTKRHSKTAALNSDLKDTTGYHEEEEEEEDEEEDGNSVEAIKNKKAGDAAEDQEDEREEGDDEEDDDDEEEEDEEGPKPIPAHILRKFRPLFRSLIREERRMREDCVSMYITDSNILVDELNSIREERSEERRIFIENYCKRRSGWSHLQALRLRGNPVGNEGAKAAALVLRHEVELEEEESEQIRTDLSNKADKILDVLLAERNKNIFEEAASRKQILLEHRTAWESFAAILRVKHAPQQMNHANNNGDDDDDEEEENTVPTYSGEGEDNFEHLSFEMTDGAHDADNMVAEFVEEQSSVLEEARGNWETPFPPTKRGLQSLRLLDLSSCQVGTYGAKKICDALQTNESLEVLLLRHNCFARKRVALHGNDNDDDADEPTSPKRVDVPHYVSPGCTSLCKALTINKSLRVLDLAYNYMYPETIRHLALALKSNTTLACLSLEGNCMGFNESPYEMDPNVLQVTGYPVDVMTLSRPSCFLELLQAVYTTGITTLLLGHNDLSSCWKEEEAKLLAKLSCRLHVLHLNGNGLMPLHIAQWSDAASRLDSFSIKDLNLSRNNFHGENGGAALSLLLAHCEDNLEILNFDETHLSNSGLKCAFESFKPKALISLSIRQIKMTLSEALPLEVLIPLRRLLVSDNPFNTEEVLKLTNRVSCTAFNLVYLSIWSREVEMEEQLPILRESILEMRQLLFVDFGVLPRFDNLRDAEDPLGQLEVILVERQLTRVLNANS